MLKMFKYDENEYKVPHTEAVANLGRRGHTLDDLIQALNEAKANMPAGSTAIWCRYDDDEGCLLLYYERPATPEEIQAHRDEEEIEALRTEQRERAEFARLKAKYEL